MVLAQSPEKDFLRTLRRGPTKLVSVRPPAPLLVSLSPKQARRLQALLKLEVMIKSSPLQWTRRKRLLFIEHCPIPDCFLQGFRPLPCFPTGGFRCGSPHGGHWGLQGFVSQFSFQGFAKGVCLVQVSSKQAMSGWVLA